jgi:hypothetical protein
MYGISRIQGISQVAGLFGVKTSRPLLCNRRLQTPMGTRCDALAPRGYLPTSGEWHKSGRTPCVHAWMNVAGAATPLLGNLA